MDEKQIPETWNPVPKMTYVLTRQASSLSDYERWYRCNLIQHNREKTLNKLSPDREEAIKLLKKRFSNNALKYYYKNREKILQKIKDKRKKN